MEHPDVTRINLTGYPREMFSGVENVVAQPEHYAIDVFGNEVLEGDEIVEYDGEVILKTNLERFLSELGFTFKVAD